MISPNSAWMAAACLRCMPSLASALASASLATSSFARNSAKAASVPAMRASWPVISSMCSTSCLSICS
eukprot:CAMPEP_0183455724 /NCGR_PEP_ID=MMETSP0370-20130417/127306_1 /TAXON_ID=268820 /ORGANISM="Peridinium aciculiferum, Strain PAER-2" /LENGTH=67 /DNA_ID=CAMNT_0025647327 /DNA_START=45 /DNA_END=245 /DNA_ORIENTATION=+